MQCARARSYHTKFISRSLFLTWICSYDCMMNHHKLADRNDMFSLNLHWFTRDMISPFNNTLNQIRNFTVVLSSFVPLVNLVYINCQFYDLPLLNIYICFFRCLDTKIVVKLYIYFDGVVFSIVQFWLNIDLHCGWCIQNRKTIPVETVSLFLGFIWSSSWS